MIVETKLTSTNSFISEIKTILNTEGIKSVDELYIESKKMVNENKSIVKNKCLYNETVDQLKKAFKEHQIDKIK